MALFELVDISEDRAVDLRHRTGDRYIQRFDLPVVILQLCIDPDRYLLLCVCISLFLLSKYFTSGCL